MSFLNTALVLSLALTGGVVLAEAIYRVVQWYHRRRAADHNA